MSFTFLDPGPLIDDELELVCPGHRWTEHVLAVCRHPLTRRDDPLGAQTTRDQIEQFLRLAPGGRQPADTALGRIPAYHFWMLRRCLADRVPAAWRQRLRRWCRLPPALPLVIAGGINLRIGSNPEIERYSGNIGYHVYPPFRGRHYAERACRLLLPLARRHCVRRLWITCNPDNLPSRRTCERLGATMIDIIPIPADHEFHHRGEREKCRYLLELN